MRKKSRRDKQFIGYAYIAPWIIGFLVFQLYPLLASLFYSFTDYNIIGTPNFVGFDNYINMFTKDKSLFTSLERTFLYVLMGVPLKLAFAFFIAMLLNAKLRFISLFRTIYYLPSIVGGSVAIAILWRILFMREGVANAFLAIFGIKPINFLGDPEYALFIISIITVWQFGSSMVIFLAGLKQIPEELYEAARVDGASRVRCFFGITIPLITPTIFFNLVMQTINAFQDFNAAMIVTNGGPMKTTYLYALKLYDEAFKFFKMGYASALAWLLFLIILAFTAMIFKSSPMWVHYQDGGDR